MDSNDDALKISIGTWCLARGRNTEVTLFLSAHEWYQIESSGVWKNLENFVEGLRKAERHLLLQEVEG